MRVEGRWHLFDDGILRPVVDSFVQTAEGTWQVANVAVSVLGRDVTNNFDVIYSFPRREVMLLAPPHTYQVQLPS